jgi:transcriptional regulator
MYTPKHFEVTDEETIFDFIGTNSFGVIVSNHGGIPIGTHMPFLLDRRNKYLTGHFARPNEQWKEIEGQEILIIFQGPHHYISSSWYETNLSVPTWNYVAVHVYGTIEWMTESVDLLKTLNELTEKYETQDNPYRIDQSNIEFVEGLMKGIVGFRIKISRLEGKWKLSQNHSKERQERVIQELEKIQSEDALHIAELMKKIVLK